ncbi:hypothetical protein SUGI_0702990 [Cryptomeria japonica]|nr:hypothetical protein SUGI_0702990 [Cryptomeria japonica]
MIDPSTSTASPPSGSTGSCSSSGSTNILPVDVLALEGCIDEVLSSLTDKGLRRRKDDFGLVKQLGNVHWAVIGLLAIANVLERFDKISTNDEDCFDLLKLMLDLAKFLKQLKDMNADFHKELSEKTDEVLHLIFRGAVLCRSFIAYKKC